MTFPALAVVAVLSTAGVDATPAAPVDTPARVNVFFAPVAGVALSVLGTLGYRGPTLYAPSGFTVAVGPNWGITGELAGLIVFAGTGGYGISASVGPTWLPSGRGVEGLFVTPKLTFDLSRTPTSCLAGCAKPAGNSGPVDLGPGVERSFLAGFDVGYQFSGRTSASLVIGASAGYGYDNGLIPLVSPLTSTTSSALRRQGFVWALNLSVLRVGFSR